MKRLLTFLIPFLLLFSSCDYFIAHPDQERPKIYMFSIGLGYGTGPENNVLENTLSDSDAMAKEIEALAKSYELEYEILSFRDDFNKGSSSWQFTIERFSSSGTNEVLPFIPLERDDVSDEFISFLRSSLEGEVDGNDIMIFYFSGHGEDYSGGLYVYHYEDEDGYKYTAMPAHTVIDFIKSFPSSTLMILDSCYSGVYVEENDVANLNDGIEAILEAFANSTGKESGNFKDFAITAAHNTVSYDNDPYQGTEGAGRHGAFTYQVLSYLGYDFEHEEGVITNGKRTICLSEMYRHVMDNISWQIRLGATPNVCHTRYDLVLFSPY